MADALQWTGRLPLHSIPDHRAQVRTATLDRFHAVLTAANLARDLRAERAGARLTWVGSAGCAPCRGRSRAPPTVAADGFSRALAKYTIGLQFRGGAR